jgi:hypothetical protein
MHLNTSTSLITVARAVVAVGAVALVSKATGQHWNRHTDIGMQLLL